MFQSKLHQLIFSDWNGSEFDYVQKSILLVPIQWFDISNLCAIVLSLAPDHGTYYIHSAYAKEGELQCF